MELGTWAELASAVGTVGALFTTIYLIWSDKRHRETEQVRALAITIGTFTISGQKKETGVSLEIRNFASMPVKFAAVIGPDQITREEDPTKPSAMIYQQIIPVPDATTNSNGMLPALEPGAFQSVDILSRGNINLKEWHVVLSMGDGSNWVIKPVVSKVLSRRRAKRMSKKAHAFASG